MSGKQIFSHFETAIIDSVSRERERLPGFKTLISIKAMGIKCPKDTTRALGESNALPTIDQCV